MKNFWQDVISGVSEYMWGISYQFNICCHKCHICVHRMQRKDIKESKIWTIPMLVIIYLAQISLSCASWLKSEQLHSLVIKSYGVKWTWIQMLTQPPYSRRHHQFNGCELGQTPGDDEGQGGLPCCSPRGHKESHTTWRLNNKLLSLSQACFSSWWSEVKWSRSVVSNSLWPHGL